MNSGDERRIEDTIAMLREAHRAPIPEAHLAAVRARVLAEIEAGRRETGWWPLRWKWVACAVAAATALMLFPVRPSHVAPPRKIMAPVVETAAIGRPDNAVRHTASRRASIPRRVAKPVPHPQLALVAESYRVIGPPDLQPLVVKFVTNDPDVVIYWIAEPKGGY